uniref:alpha-1,6-mannosyl-glycoprotein 6-beta-N-acetylglucosaminyltransferase n=1 Tax=Plectus sambesii TaxID=2011161 RepID=A0A914V0S6_9BILA
MTDNPTSYNWIKSRITRMWPKWESAFDAVVAKQNWTLQNRPKLRILLHMGFLTKESGFKFSEKSASGGPLGELVQWSDLITSLFILGHQLTISTEIKTFTSFAQADPALKSSCQISNANKHVDLIYTDIVGLRQMKRKIPGSLLNYKCRLRVLDSFGTQAEFNDPIYFTKHKANLGGKPKNVWGGHRLNLRQFFTMFPHSPDNSFLGFVVEMHASNATTMATEHRNNSALVYGKEAYMWKDATPFLKEVQKQTQLHSTVNADKPIFPGVVNHGVLNGEEFHQLLRRVKIFVGLGFPYEGPAPLEAIANGAVFLNPKFVTPKGRRTEKFFAEKPTLRALTSQSPYLEEFIGEPYVLTFDISNGTAVREAVAKALAAKTAPYLPYEFTAPGMLERVNAFLLHQDWCSSSSSWPPFSAAQIVFAQVGQSCQTACSAQGLVCERTFFTQINRLEVMKGHGSCTTSEEVPSTQAPAVSGEHCLLQDNELLFSCATEPVEDTRRLCPCRDFMAVDGDGAGPLHLLAGSSSEHSYATALVLLERGADPNARTIDGLTPVHIACEWGQYELLRIFLLFGGDPSLRTSDGQTAFDLALQQKNYFCVQLLRSWQKSEQSPMAQANTSAVSPSSRFQRSPLREPVDDNVSLDLSIDAPAEESSRFAQFSRVETPKARAPKLREKVVRRLHFPCCLSQSSATATNKENDASQLTPPYERPQVVSTETQCSLVQVSLRDLCADCSEDVTLADDLETTVREMESQKAREVNAEKLERTLRMDDRTLRRELTARGIDVGPIVPQTKGLYAHRLACLLEEEEEEGGERASGAASRTARKKYSTELEAALGGRLSVEAAREDETALMTHFDESVVQGRPWREGVLKMSFCYILLDPIVLQRLPSLITDADRFRCFVDAIFYIGKGKRSRPYQHLIEAVTLRQNRNASGEQVMSDKTRRIVDMWDRGYGVVSLHVFQNTIPVEAFAREAAMIDAIGLSNLTNIRRGDYYGAAVGWTVMRRRRFGCYLLKQAMTALDVEGCRQLLPTDIV